MSDDWGFSDEQYEREQLHFAAQEGDLERAKRLIEAGFPVSAFDDLGYTPLHYAADKGHLDVMRALIRAGANVNAQDDSQAGDTPLGMVAGNCSFEVAKVLIDAGADPTIPGGMMITPLWTAENRKRPEGVRVKKLLQDAAKRLTRGA